MKRVLIIEDEPVIAEVYRNKLLRRGFLVELAPDGKAGLEKVEQWKPELILLDLLLPRINGMDLLRTIRKHPISCNVPVVVYSNSFSKAVSDEARQLGVEHVLSKSETRPNQVLDLISNLLNGPGTGFIPPPPAEAAAKAAADAPAEAKEQANCLQSAQRFVAGMRKLLKEFFKRDDKAALASLHAQVHMFGMTAWIAGLQRAAHVSDALETLLLTLKHNEKYINFSTDKTILQAIDCLEKLVSDPATAQLPFNKKPAILVVDDQEVALQATAMGLKKAGLPVICEQDSERAMKMIEVQPWDLILLDIDMPKIDGMKLCTHIRTLPLHQNTPVIFFSQLSEIEHRIASTVAGGNDFIGKPFLSIELAVKALVWLAKQVENPAPAPR